MGLNLQSNLEKMIMLICKDEYKEFLKYENVLGIALGEKIIGGKKTGIKCIHVYVKEKIRNLQDKYCVPKFHRGIPTDIIETGEISVSDGNSSNSSNGFTKKLRPFKPGYSIGPASSKTTGTGCCLVIEGRSTGEKILGLLSTSHVVGDDNKQKKGDAMIQPGALDKGNTGDTFGYVSNYEPLQFEKEYVNYADVGVIKLTVGPAAIKSNVQIMTPEIAFLPKPRGTDIVSLSEKVQKSGAGTGYTTGEIVGLGATVVINYPDKKQAIFLNQIISTKIGSYKDSGSAILNMQNYIVGMFIATTKLNISIINPISTALGIMNCELFI